MFTQCWRSVHSGGIKTIIRRLIEEGKLPSTFLRYASADSGVDLSAEAIEITSGRELFFSDLEEGSFLAGTLSTDVIKMLEH